MEHLLFWFDEFFSYIIEIVPKNKRKQFLQATQIFQEQNVLTVGHHEVANNALFWKYMVNAGDHVR